jgi:hypothetical protein
MNSEYNKEAWAITIFNNEVLFEKKSIINIETRTSCHATKEVLFTIECEKVSDVLPNLERMVKCVNAMNGIESPYSLVEQRDDLLEMLKSMVSVFEPYPNDSYIKIEAAKRLIEKIAKNN